MKRLLILLGLAISQAAFSQAVVPNTVGPITGSAAGLSGISYLSGTVTNATISSLSNNPANPSFGFLWGTSTNFTNSYVGKGTATIVIYENDGTASLGSGQILFSNSPTYIITNQFAGTLAITGTATGIVTISHPVMSNTVICVLTTNCTIYSSQLELN